MTNASIAAHQIYGRSRQVHRLDSEHVRGSKNKGLCPGLILVHGIARRISLREIAKGSQAVQTAG
jgi:hypothetical protein